MSNWHEMSDTKKAEALAELLGWRQIELHPPTGGIEWWWAGDPQEDGTRLIGRIDYFRPYSDWRSMGLVVAAERRLNDSTSR